MLVRSKTDKQVPKNDQAALQKHYYVSQIVN